MPVFKLRQKPSEDAGAAIVAFHSKWDEPLRNDAFRVVYRKAFSKSFSPAWIYAYLSKPVSAIVARMPVKRCEHKPVIDAVAFSAKSMLSEDEIWKYANNYSELLVMEIGKIEYAKTPITFARLASEYDFWPSSTYTPLSNAGKDTLDKLGFG